MTVEAIKEAIAALPLTERRSLSVWLNEIEYDSWDRQMAADFSPGGRGMALVEKVRREAAEEKAVSFDEGLAHVKREGIPPQR